MLSDLVRPLTSVIFGLAILIALLSNFRALHMQTGGKHTGVGDAHDAMVQKMLSNSQRTAKKNLKQVLAERKRKRREAGVPQRPVRRYPVDDWKKGQMPDLEEEEIEAVPADRTSYLGFDGVPWGSCFEPHPYFRPDPATTDISLPIVNLGFPKAGTTSFQNFLECGKPKWNVSHQFCRYQPLLFENRKQKIGDYCGRCLTDAARNETFAKGIDDPLYRCGNYDAFTQIDMTSGSGGCYWPQVDMLNIFHKFRPDATFTFSHRPFEKWYGSMSKWHQYHMRLANCQLGEYPNGVLDRAFEARRYQNLPRVRVALKKFYCEQVERVRKFVLRHPSHKLVEIMVGDPNVGDYLSELFDVDHSCWGAHNVNPKSETHKELLAGNGTYSKEMTVALAKQAPIAKRRRQKPKNETSIQLWRAQKAAKQRKRKQKQKRAKQMYMYGAAFTEST
jgi:hypothetical protein